jgi:hypothetical protein
MHIWIERDHPEDTSACGVYYDCLVTGEVLWVVQYDADCIYGPHAECEICPFPGGRKRFWRLWLIVDVLGRL